ncbi:hypothetical protein KEM55_001848 [Ascosphaera atra]|nr:hypothetical protein KEM55_001848 [Ascosphaera atra]
MNTVIATTTTRTTTITIATITMPRPLASGTKVTIWLPQTAGGEEAGEFGLPVWHGSVAEKISTRGGASGAVLKSGVDWNRWVREPKGSQGLNAVAWQVTTPRAGANGEPCGSCRPASSSRHHAPSKSSVPAFVNVSVNPPPSTGMSNGNGNGGSGSASSASHSPHSGTGTHTPAHAAGAASNGSTTPGTGNGNGNTLAIPRGAPPSASSSASNSSMAHHSRAVSLPSFSQETHQRRHSHHPVVGAAAAAANANVSSQYAVGAPVGQQAASNAQGSGPGSGSGYEYDYEYDYDYGYAAVAAAAAGQYPGSGHQQGSHGHQSRQSVAHVPAGYAGGGGFGGV